MTPGTGWWDSLSWDKGMSREQRRVMGLQGLQGNLNVTSRHGGRGWQWVGSEGLNVEGHTYLVLF